MAAKNIYHHGDLRQKIIDEALCKIEEKNIISLSLREIARRIRVSHNAFYRHFPDKESGNQRKAGQKEELVLD